MDGDMIYLIYPWRKSSYLGPTNFTPIYQSYFLSCSLSLSLSTISEVAVSFDSSENPSKGKAVSEMKSNINTPVSYPSPDEINPFHRSPHEPNETTPPIQTPHPQYPSVSNPTPLDTTSSHPPTTSHKNSGSSHPPAYDESAEKWGTHLMGHPAVPTCHPANKKAALWGASTQEAQRLHNPYVQYSPIDSASSSTGHSMLQAFDSWSNKAESLANNIWNNLKTGSSVPGAAWAKVNVTAKAITGGGFEHLYKQTFATYPNEKLNKTFACYLSTSTGPVAGTLYLSNVHVAFCSDRPLSFTAPSGQQSWSYYKVMIPVPNVGTINPVVMRENPTEKYIQIVTIDGQDFWFMGFVNYEKASRHLTQSISSLVPS